jgi:hypothetical protein
MVAKTKYYQMIDIEKFLCSLLSQTEEHHGEPINRSNIQEALREQGYEVVNGKLISLTTGGPWELSDANPGDFLTIILENELKYILIYQQTENERIIMSYAHWAVGAQVYPEGGVVALGSDQIKIMPSTKAEREEFMMELRKAGYRWNQENREIIPIYTTKFKVGDTIYHRENRDICHVIEKIDLSDGCYRCTDGSVLEIKAADEKYVVPEFHERISDLNLILEWFAHIEQLATDRKTQNGYVMTPQDTLDEIKVLAKNSQEYIKAHVAPEKIIFRQADVDRMVSKFKTEPLKSDGRVADIYKQGIDDILKELRLRYEQKGDSD